MQAGTLAPEDITALIDGKITEGRILDYKQTVATRDNDVRELLDDLVSFANTDGGWILIGLNEAREGSDKLDYADAVVDHGLKYLDFRKRIENVAADNIYPRLPRLVIYEVQIGGKSVIGIYVERSTLRPHVVQRQSRISSSRRKLDAAELFREVLSSQTVEDRFKEFVGQRAHTVHKFLMPPAFAVHVAPREAFARRLEISFATLNKMEYLRAGGHGRNWREPSAHGIVAYSGTRVRDAYSEVFRMGVYEGVDTEMFNSDHPSLGLFINSSTLEQTLNDIIRNAVECFAIAELGGPYLVSATLVCAESYGLFLEKAHRPSRGSGERLLRLPVFLMEDVSKQKEAEDALLERLAHAHGQWKFVR